VNAEQWNALYLVGTLVFAYPAARPERDRNATRLVTRTCTEAQLSYSGTPVVWVEGEGSYISLTHVDPVSESAWQAAKQAEETAAAVAAQGALPVPVGEQPQPLDDARLAEIRERADAAHPGPWRRSDDESSLERYVLSEDDLFAVSFGYRGNNTQAEADFIAHARQDVPALLAEVERLKAERHTTNEALTDAAEALRANRDRIAELEQELTAAVEVSEGLYRTLHDEKLAGSALYAALTMPTTAEQRQAALDRFLAVAQRTGQLHAPTSTPAEEAAS
jgi:hypothetical protein